MVEMTRKQIINSDYTVECPTCGYMIIGFEPRHYLECDKCLKINYYKVNYLYGEEVVHAYPDGWTCVGCGTSFDEKTINVECLYVIHTQEGTHCLKCFNDIQDNEKIINETVPLTDIKEANKTKRPKKEVKN